MHQLGEDDVILFLDDNPNRAALMYGRMSSSEQNSTIWVTTAEEAIYVLRDYHTRLVVAYLDHDLGGLEYVHSGREDCGMEVVRYLEKQDPALYARCHFIVHSWNIPAGKKMAERLKAKGYSATHAPFGT